MMGAGKSTVGPILAGRLGWAWFDSDDEIVRRTGRTVPEIWRSGGEQAFRSEEAAVLADASSSPRPIVVGVGGGAVVHLANRARLAQAGLVVWLRVGVATLMNRLGDGAGRPLLEGDPAGALTRLEAERRAIYETLAQVVVDVDDLNPDAVADRIIVELGLCKSRRIGAGPDGSVDVSPEMLES